MTAYLESIDEGGSSQHEPKIRRTCNLLLMLRILARIVKVIQ